MVWFRLYYSKPNYLMEVGDDTGTVNLTVERSIIPNPSKAGTGSLLDLTVDAGALTVLNVSIVEAEPSPLLHTSEVTFDRIGTTAVVEGNVTNFQTIGSNLKFVLADSTGNVTIFIPGSVAYDLPQDIKDGLTNGVSVRISGYITEYRGTIEIIPYRPECVELLS
ncbi:hypothetical protein A3L09_00230 [Thermococcus profundus]|uniref:OB domain-containing protein n=1 Tax=Thermococcus profundus TaxID=49899 RepID=A0A2Z2M804_THEPR|nr:hypothetical protein A3L09_00230 [Thermococcus profundus]